MNEGIKELRSIIVGLSYFKDDQVSWNSQVSYLLERIDYWFEIKS